MKTSQGGVLGKLILFEWLFKYISVVRFMIFLNYRLEFKVAWFKPKALSTIIYVKSGLNRFNSRAEWLKPRLFFSTVEQYRTILGLTVLL